VANFSVNDGRLTVGRLDSPGNTSVFDDFSVAVTDFSRTSQFHFKLATKLPGGGDATLTGNAGPIPFSNAAATPFNVAVAAHGINISAYGFVDPASGISGQASMDGTLASDGSTAIASDTFTGKALTFAPKGKPSPKVITIQNKVEVDLGTQLVKITQSDIAIGNAKFQMTGTIQNKANERVANLRLTGTNVPIDDIQAVLPSAAVRLPLGSHLQGGTLSINFILTGPLVSPTLSGHVQVADTKLVGYNLGAQLGSMASFAGKAISQPDTFIHRLSCDEKVTLAGTTSYNIQSDIPSVAYSTGAGTVSPDGALDYAMLSYPASGMAGGLIKMASIGGGKGYIPLAIKGTVERPIFVPDTRAAAHILIGQTAKGVAAVSVNAIKGLFHKKKDADKQK
jgi:AsmA protein